MVLGNSLTINRPQRWDQPFGPDMTDDDVARVLSTDLFSKMDQSRFPPNASLGDIVRNDSRLIRFGRGEIIVRTGDHGDSAFLIMSGHVGVVLQPELPQNLLGRAETATRSVWSALAQIWERPKMPEVRDVRKVLASDAVDLQTSSDGEFRTRLPDLDKILNEYRIVELGPGEMFGEIAALTRTSRTNTIFAKDDVELLEIRRPGLRDVRRRVESFKAHVDQLYRDRSLQTHLRYADIFAHLDDETIDVLVKRTRFETYGDFDWQTSFMRVAEGTPDERLKKEPVIASEGDYPDGLLMVRSGFARVSFQVDNGHQTTTYLGHGSLFGLEEIVHNWRYGDNVPLQHSLRAVGYTDILRVPTRIIEECVLPNVAEERLPRFANRRKHMRAVSTDRRAGSGTRIKSSKRIGTDVLEFLVDNRVINGTQTMLIDLDRCVRCDACSEACAVGHNNNPRFNRHGRRVQNLMVANACMHCNDPVCMIGCPTGAIHRVEGTGQVVVNDQTCIGCATCANNCPYNNIRMVEIRDDDGHPILDKLTGQPVVKSTKCDLCADQVGGPACQRACPHDALVRMDMSDTEHLAEWLER